jgi:hypothetical protein
MTEARAPWLVALTLGLAALGCGAEPSEQTERAEQSIVFGEPSGADQDGVLLLRAVPEGGNESLCTASLVAPQLLVTARHCVSYFNGEQFSCTVAGEAINNPTGGGKLGLHLPPESIEVYAGGVPRKAPLAHGAQIFSTLSSTICKNDLAFVALDTAVEAPLVPLRLGRSAEVGEKTVMIGYGMTESQDSIDYRKQPRAQKRDLDVSAVGLDSIADGTPVVTPRTIVVDEPCGCIGDSGGPLLAQATGALLGVYSVLEGNGCASPDASHRMTHVPPFQALIEEAFAAVGSTPVPETEAPGASGGAGGATATPAPAGGSPDIDPSAGGTGDTGTPPGDAKPHDESSGCSVGAARSLDDARATLGIALLMLAMLRCRRRATA